MKWSWRIARISGIDVNMHVTFLILLAWVAASYWIAGNGLASALEGVAYVLALFTCVVLHEFGHALTARRYGIPTRDITLLPIGGVARLERMPDKPAEELRVALSGPLVNLVLAAILLVVLLATGTLPPLNQLTVTGGSFLARLLVVNLILALFNLIPAFPMDGGRVLRAALATRMEYTRATQVAAVIGQGFAVLLGFFGLFNNPLLLFIAFFVWIGASQEASLVQVKSALAGIPVSRAMLTHFETVAPTDPLSRPVELVLAGLQQDFPVVADGVVVGLLPRDDLIRALQTHGANMLVSHVMRKDFKVVDAGQMLESISQQMQENGQSLLPVTSQGQLVGLVNLENIGEFLMIQNALTARREARRVV